MKKFIMECPSCGKSVEASSGFFAKKKIDCSCGYTIDVKTDKMAAKVCPACEKNIVYDQSKVVGGKIDCPFCNEKIDLKDKTKPMVEFSCPSCGCHLETEKGTDIYTCPLCETDIDVNKQIEKEKVKGQGLASIIKYEGGNDVFVWKHPIEDFNLGSQIIVNESQEAVFFQDGKALDAFKAGRYTLATSNLPSLKDLGKLPASEDDVFHSVVYFVNMTTHMGIKWGTDSKVRLFDPASGLHIELGAFGSLSLRVVDSRKLLVSLVGTSPILTDLDVNGVELFGIPVIVGKFKSLIISKVKANLARAIKENQINVLEIDEYIDVLSDKLRGIINVTLEEYGLYMPEFFVTSIMTPDDDPNFRRLKQQFADKTLKVREEEIRKAEAEAAQSRQILEAQTQAQLKMMAAQGDAETLKIKAQAEADAYRMQAFAEADEMKAKGYTYQQETERMVGMEAMKNNSGMLGDVAGIGITLGAMDSVIGITKDAFKPEMPNLGVPSAPTPTVAPTAAPAGNDTWTCACGQAGITSKFCPECGAKKPEAPASWDCACGQTGITSKFCPECGAKKPEVPATWNCACGQTGITSNFCPECGTKRG